MRIKPYEEKIRKPKSRYTTTICERSRCPHFLAIASPRYAGLCLIPPTVGIKAGARKCLKTHKRLKTDPEVGNNGPDKTQERP
jgi:hypothetical protein